MALATCAIVKWGRAEMDWKWIGLSAAIPRTNYHRICDVMKISGVYNAYLLFRLSPSSDLQPMQLSFIELLRLTRQFEVTDTWDRVYGLLGIRMTGSRNTEPLSRTLSDYKISDAELWKRLAHKFIRESQSLSVLSSVQYTTDGFEWQPSSKPRRRHQPSFNCRYPEGHLPSWVPHWEVVYRATLTPWDQDDRFAVAKNFPLRLNCPVGSSKLIVEGIQVGIVGKCCSYMWHKVDVSVPGT